MTAIKLGPQHVEQVKLLFDDNEHELYTTFCQTYLTELPRFHAFGNIDKQGNLTSFISLFESMDDAAWYWLDSRYQNFKEVAKILDAVIEHSESRGFLKFYCLLPKNDDSAYNKILVGKNSKRYDFYDEFYVEAKEKCLFNLPWQILYWRTLPEIDSMVRCTFLKKEYRTLFKASNL